MLQSLQISNYALIDQLSIRFHPGLNIITGETGAGKSIILGALGLILGERADMTILQNKEKKCAVEGIFHIDGYQLEGFFRERELDYDDQTIIRREITPAGKSRAFINDTPVNLKVLQDLSLRLIDIHSQHQSLELGNRLFQMKLIDLVAGNEAFLKAYELLYAKTQEEKARLSALKDEAERSKADLDYFRITVPALDDARLREGSRGTRSKQHTGTR